MPVRYLYANRSGRTNRKRTYCCKALIYLVKLNKYEKVGTCSKVSGTQQTGYGTMYHTTALNNGTIISCWLLYSLSIFGYYQTRRHTNSNKQAGSLLKPNTTKMYNTHYVDRIK